MISTPGAEDRGARRAVGRAGGARRSMRQLKAADLAALRAMDPASRSPPPRPRRLRPLGRGRRPGAARPARRTCSTRASRRAVPLLAGFNSGEIRSLTLLAPPRARERRRVREHDPRALRRSRRRVPASSIRPTICRRASSRRRATRSTAGPPSGSCASRPRSGSRPISTCGTTAIPRPTTAGLHAFHASELPYVFGTFDGTPPLWPKNAGHARASMRSSDAMVDYWTSFARTGRAAARRTRPTGRRMRPTRATCTSPRRRRPDSRSDAGHVRAERGR